MTDTFKIIVLLSLALVSSGCSSGSASNLAAKTGDNAVNLAVGLDSFTRASSADAERRAATVARLAAIIAEDKLRLERTIALAKEAGRKEPVTLYEALKKRADLWAGREKEQENLAAEARQELLAAQSQMKTQAGALRVLGGQLHELSKGDSGKSRVKFLIDFAKGVTKELKAAKAAAAANQGGN